MLKRIRFFGVRKRLNQVIDLLNGGESEGLSALDLSEFYHTTEARLENAISLFADIFKSLVVVNHRLDVIEKQQENRFTAEVLKKMGKKLDDESLTFALETIEGLEARIDLLEEALLPRSEQGETSETHLSDREEEG